MTSDLESRIPDPFIFDDVVPADLSPAELTENARIVLSRRYLKKDEAGKPIEQPETMFWRVARVIAEADRNYGASDAAIEEVARQFYDLMTTGKFEPNSPTLMNAGRPLGQLSACFVLPVDDALSNGQSGIYDTLKAMALVHQSGGGCVAGDAHVHTTFCGVETIETLYQRVRALGVEEAVREDHRIMDVSHLNIRTLALDPASGAFEPRAVTHLWAWDVPAEQQYTVRCADGAQVTTSAWHPFMVFSPGGVVERRADQLRDGDVLLAPNRSVRERWPIHALKEVEGFTVDEHLAWLVGYALGDGSLDLFRNRTNRDEALRLRLFDGHPDSVRFAAEVLARHGVYVTPGQDSRGLWRLTTTSASFVPAFARLAEMTPGVKEDLTVPEWVAKSPLPVIGAFLSGLVDSDCEVNVERRRVVLSTVCPRLARRLVSLLSTLGFNPSFQKKAPTGKAKRTEYRVKLAEARKSPELVDLLAGWVHDPFRRERLESLRERADHDTRRRIPLPFEALSELLETAGVDVHDTALHRGPAMIAGEPFWLHRLKWGQGIGEDKLRRLSRALRRALPESYHGRLEQLERLSDGWAVVRSVARAEQAKPFFDFTVEGLNTYLAGGGDGKMLVIHNTGFSFSRLRPEGDNVRSTMGVASGPVSFMKLYDASTEVVKQGGSRRGANMGILRVDHPDIRKFITCKDDTSQVTNFNISVAITDAFMEAVKKGEKYDLVNPRTNKVVGQEDAREIFNMIVHGAWKTGEPGTFFIDRANEYNPVPKLMSYEATNPCVVGSTRMATDRGLLTMEELWQQRMEIQVATDNRVPHARAVVWTKEQGGTAVAVRAKPGVTVFPAVPVFKTREDAPVFRLRTTHGHEILATDNHKFFTPRGPVELAELRPGDRLLLQSGEGPWSRERALPAFEPTNKLAARIARGEAELPREWSRELGQVLGWIVGDGWVTQNLGERRNVPTSVVGLLFGDAERELEPVFRERIRRWTGSTGTRSERPGRVQLLFTSGFFYFLESLGAVTTEGKTNRVPRALWSAPRDAVVGFLQGLFTADGTVNLSINKQSCSVRLASSDPELVREVQILLHNFGIASRIRLRRQAGRKAMPDSQGGVKEYAYRAQYELILDKANRDRFLREIGFLTAAKQQKAEAWLAGKTRASNRERFLTQVDSIESAGREDVYCTTEFHTHSIVVNALVTANCGEQPLGPYDVCNLGSVNLAPFVKPEYRAGEGDPLSGVDWEALRRVVHLSTHFLDNVIDANRYPLDEIHRLAQTIRRIGLGVMGWADMLVRLGVPYNTPEGVELGRTVMEFIEEESRNASEKLAEGRGVFPAWAESIWGPDTTCARRADGTRVRPMRRLRNCNLTTVAPTGTISIFAGCSSGIEPLFAVAFMRNQAGAMMPDVNPDFVRLAKQQAWYSDELMARIAQEGHIHFPEVPLAVQRVFVTAHDIVPEWHVRMQAAFQEHVDSAISKCIAAGTLIPTNRGLVPVEAFAKPHEPDSFAPTDGEYTTGGHRILSHYRAGRKPATSIRLDDGAELVGATASHRVLTPEGWRLMAQLQRGDMVVGRFQESHGPGGARLEWAGELRTCANHIPTPARMSPAFGKFLGMLAADGYTGEKDGRVEITCKNDHVAAEFRTLCKEIFGLLPKESVDSRNGVLRLFLTSRNLVRFIESLIGRGAYGKHVPDAVLQGSFEEKVAFLEGITLDGYATPQGLVVYAGMSKTLAYHVAELSRSFGLPRVNQGRKWVEASQAFSYDVVVSNELQEIITPIEPHKRVATVYKRYKVLADVREMARSGFGSRTTEYYALRAAQYREQSFLFNTTAERLGLPADTPVHRITEVEDAGVVELYDVEVEHAHEYVVNGMVSHNTTNFPFEATEQDVRAIYELAYDLNCKGVTVYRDGSRPMQVLSTGKTGKQEARPEETAKLEEAAARIAELELSLADTREEAHRLRVRISEVERERHEKDQVAAAGRHKRQRPVMLRGRTVKMNSPLGDLYVTINEDEQGRPFEVFCTLGKAGGAAMADAEAIGRLISLALRSGIPITALRDQLRGISCDRAVGLGPNKVLSAPDAIGQAIERYLEEKEGVQEALPFGVRTTTGALPEAQPRATSQSQQETFLGTCPDCGTGHLAYLEGCVKCHICGYSECG